MNVYYLIRAVRGDKKKCWVVFTKVSIEWYDPETTEVEIRHTLLSRHGRTVELKKVKGITDLTKIREIANTVVNNPEPFIVGEKK